MNRQIFLLSVLVVALTALLIGCPPPQTVEPDGALVSTDPVQTDNSDMIGREAWGEAPNRAGAIMQAKLAVAKDIVKDRTTSWRDAIDDSGWERGVNRWAQEQDGRFTVRTIPGGYRFEGVIFINAEQMVEWLEEEGFDDGMIDGGRSVPPLITIIPDRIRQMGNAFNTTLNQEESVIELTAKNVATRQGGWELVDYATVVNQVASLEMESVGLSDSVSEMTVMPADVYIVYGTITEDRPQPGRINLSLGMQAFSVFSGEQLGAIQAHSGNMDANQRGGAVERVVETAINDIIQDIQEKWMDELEEGWHYKLVLEGVTMATLPQIDGALNSIGVFSHPTLEQGVLFAQWAIPVDRAANAVSLAIELSGALQARGLAIAGEPTLKRHYVTFEVE